MDFNFWKTPLIKNLENGNLPQVETTVSINKESIIILTMAAVFIIVIIFAAKKFI